MTARQIAACPKASLLPGHYAEDGTCNCGRREQIDAELQAIEAILADLAADRKALDALEHRTKERRAELRRTR